MTALAAACASLAAGASLSACAVPGTPAAKPTAPNAIAATQTTHEVAGRAPRQAVAGPGAATAKQAVWSFAVAYINWSADTVGRDMRALAADSVGQARSALQLAASQTAGDYELKRGGIANMGVVEAVAPLPGSRSRYVVVTRESTTATATTTYQGLRPQWHVTIATVTALRGTGWVLSGWQPQS